MANLKFAASRWLKCAFVILFCSGCAHEFPRPDAQSPRTLQHATTQLSASQIFTKTLNRHGGEKLDQLKDVNFSIDGDWKFLITRIQPLVTDYKYRVASQERVLLAEKIYAAAYQGPGGRKQVFYSPRQTRVFYNGEETQDPDVLKSSALTANAFYLFLLGPLALADLSNDFIRLPDTRENNRNYHRLYVKLVPGFGQSDGDELVLWIDAEDFLSYRLHITLEGYKTTQGAHVDVTYNDYVEYGSFVFPSHFHERVRAPIAIDAHTWQLTGIDINRGLNKGDVSGQKWSARASRAAEKLAESNNQ